MVDIIHITRVDIVLEQQPWPFAVARRAEIDRHFDERCRARPGLWNGRVLLLYRHALVDNAFHGTCLEADYASFLAWRDWGMPDPTVSNCFAAAALRSSDGRYLLGEMAAHTANAGHVYFPCGTPEPCDLVDGRLDLEANARREFAEETGLDAGDFATRPGWTMVADGPNIVFLKRLNATQSADRLQERVRAHLGRTAHAELAAVHFVRHAADLARPLPAFVAAFLADASAQQG